MFVVKVVYYINHYLFMHCLYWRTKNITKHVSTISCLCRLRMLDILLLKDISVALQCTCYVPDLNYCFFNKSRLLQLVSLHAPLATQTERVAARRGSSGGDTP